MSHSDNLKEQAEKYKHKCLNLLYFLLIAFYKQLK